MLDIMAEKSVDTEGSVFKQQVQSDFYPTLYSILSLKITDNVLNTVVQKSTDTRSYTLNNQGQVISATPRICSQVYMYT
jgi:hypothetical protein